jgi:hypothetical protein
MTKLGDIFNKEAEKKQFSNSEKHWGELESMLDKHDASKKGGSLLWFAGAGVFIVAVLASWFALSDNSTSEIAAIDSQSKTVVGNSTSTVQAIKKENDVAISNSEVSQDKTLGKAVSNDNMEIMAQEPVMINQNQPSEQVVENTSREDTFDASQLSAGQIGGVSVASANAQKAAGEEGEYTEENYIGDTHVDETSQRDIAVNRQALENNNSILGTAFPQVRQTESLELMNLLEIAPLCNEIDIVSPSEDFIDGGSQPIKLELGIYGGPMYVGKYLTSAKELPYVQRRKNEESGKLSFNTGLDVSLKYGKLIVGTGVNYHQQGEVTNYSNEYESWEVNQLINYDVTDNSYWQLNTSSFTIITDDNFAINVDTVLNYYDETSSLYVSDTVLYQSYVINNIGTQQFDLVDSSYVVDLDSVATITMDSILTLITDANNPEQKTTTRFSYVEVPVLIGCEIPINRLTLSCRTGLGIGLLTTYEARYLLSDYSAPQLIEQSEINQIMLNYLLRAGVKYLINESVAINCEPFYRLNLSNVINSNELNQKYWNVGVNVGVMYGF